MNDHLAAFRRTFRQVHALSLNIMRRQLPRDDRFLREMMMSTIRGQVTADYAFVFQCAFCRRESDVSKVNRLAAAVHLLQSSAFVTDDIFDHSDLRYGHAALYKKYGVSYAIIATELMQSTALRAISQELEGGRFANTLSVIEIFNRVVFDLYVGQYLDVRNTGNLSMTLPQYYRVIALGVGKYFEQLARCWRMRRLLKSRAWPGTGTTTEWPYSSPTTSWISPICRPTPARVTVATWRTAECGCRSAGKFAGKGGGQLSSLSTPVRLPNAKKLPLAT